VLRGFELPIIYSENPVHRANLFSAEIALQSALRAAAGSQAAVTACYIQFFQSALASAIANSCGQEVWRSALATFLPNSSMIPQN